jgi:hypothetical protein
MVIAVHLVFHGYGFWLPNDLRGSGSTEVRKDELRELGDPHFGRRPDWDQPSRDELKEFSRQAEPMLEHELFGLTRNTVKQSVTRSRWSSHSAAIPSMPAPSSRITRMHVFARTETA